MEVKKYIIIDIQGFKLGKKNFIPKEVATYDSTGRISHFIFKAPYEYSFLSRRDKRTVDWLTRNHHTIKWTSGFVSLDHFNEILESLTRNVSIIYVKGREKAEHISKIINKSVIDLSDSISNIEKSTPNCTFHTSIQCVCALTNVYKLSQFIRKSQLKVNA